MVPHHLLDLALCLEVVYVSADEHVKIPVVDVADSVQQGAPDDISFLPSREHQRKRLLGLLRHLLETRVMTSRITAEPGHCLHHKEQQIDEQIVESRDEINDHH